MSRNYDECLSRLSELVEEFGAGKHSDINEDTTRLRFVDALFFECLDWDRFSQAETEEHTAEGVIDYSLKIEQTLLVVEAKKVGIAFNLPLEQDHKSKRLVRSIESIISLNKETEKALRQVARYALEGGVPFASVCNGHQVIAFCTQLSPGIGWRKGNAIIFDSLTTIQTHFIDFWSVLSVEGIRRFLLRDKLAEARAMNPATRRSETIPNFNRTKNRNDFQADLQILGDLVFGGRLFEDRHLFHQHCYCPGGAIPQFSRASRSYLEDRYPDLFATTAHTPLLEPAQTKKGPAAALTNLTDIHKPILLLGDVGVGKTTFLEHLFLVDWVDRKDQLIVLRVDLADKPSRSDDLFNVVATEIENSLREHYGIDISENAFLRGAYHSELCRFKKTPEGVVYSSDSQAYAEAELTYLRKLSNQADEHLRTIFRHLTKGRNKMIVLVLDNVDQRTSELQQATFIQAQIAASKWEIFVMVALRPETFVRARLDGSMSGYHPRAFTIAPPRFDQLILRRIDTAMAMLRGELPIPEIGGGTCVQIGTVAEYLGVLRHSFEQDPQLVSFCEDLSGGNMRMALDYVIAFMYCGHVDAQKILEKWGQNHNYRIPLHEFARGVMFADREYYSEREASLVMNVFDCQSGDARESFLVCGVLSTIYTSTRKNATEINDFISLEELRTKLMCVGYSYDQVSWGIDRCLGNRLIETNVKSADLEGATHARLSPTGSYYFLKLMRTFVYVDAVCMDTPISDRETLEAITDNSQLDSRFDRTTSFIRYLGRILAQTPALGSLCDWEGISHDIVQDIEKAKASNAHAIRIRHMVGKSNCN